MERDCMKKVWIYFAIGCVLAFVGLYFSEICADVIFKSMDFGSAIVLGMGTYLCIVIITCTGIIVSKISSKPNEDTPEEKEE